MLASAKTAPSGPTGVLTEGASRRDVSAISKEAAGKTQAEAGKREERFEGHLKKVPERSALAKPAGEKPAEKSGAEKLSKEEEKKKEGATF
jgi:hypothetical protein